MRRPMILSFLGTGGAWGLPELGCECRICHEMRLRNEKRGRTALLLRGRSTLLIDCGPDISGQLSGHNVGRPDAVLITHEHGDHYIGMDELLSYQRTRPGGQFTAIPFFMTAAAWKVIGRQFAYLEKMGVIHVQPVEPEKEFRVNEFGIMAFKTVHGSFGEGSVGYIIRTLDKGGDPVRIVYTSDFFSIPEYPPDLLHPDYLIMQSYWLNEPARNTPGHMSFQRALDFLRLLSPRKETYLVHIGDCDLVPGDPANAMAKKREPFQPLKPPGGEVPYPVPRHQEEWQKTVDRILTDYRLPYKCTVAYDGLGVEI
jgi:phosphoribosyl 1,2-cyclic phosphate phosphodiesterase